MRSHSVYRHASESSGPPVLGQNHVSVLPVHGALHGSGIISGQSIYPLI